MGAFARLANRVSQLSRTPQRPPKNPESRLNSWVCSWTSPTSMAVIAHASSLLRPPHAAGVLWYCFNPAGDRPCRSTQQAADGHTPVVQSRTAWRLCRAGTLTFCRPSLRFSESMVSCFRSLPASSSGVRTNITGQIYHLSMEAMCLECSLYSCCTHTDDHELIAQRWRMVVTTSSSSLATTIFVTSTNCRVSSGTSRCAVKVLSALSRLS